ncbi:hypothetical protein [Xanthomonas cissicola]|uniref:hypothetical protein n=1 Tax=Xanthomonas cissicola TaxID=86186 RepID=UPI001116E7D6|nr:hypothetical protein [Xanthomonas cissicola]KAB0529375.1 hypothetical protein F7R02_22185 [Xanthomonas cissicola]
MNRKMEGGKLFGHRTLSLRCNLSLIAFLALSASAASCYAETHYAAFTYRQTSGTRPYVPVKINGTNFLFMVHGNASFSAMTTHANANKAGITDLVQTGAYGIEEPGKVSSLGSAKAVANTFEVGGRVDSNMGISVFEIPQDPPVDGMIGIKWLKNSRVMVDFSRNRLAIPDGDKDVEAEHQRLKKKGYVAHKLSWSTNRNRFYVQPVINGTKSTFDVSTVAGVIFDDAFAGKASVTAGPVVDTYGGPTGTQGAVRENQGDYSISLDGQALVATRAKIYDTYAYDGEERPANASDQLSGYLGCDFMRANEAVIDFGAGILFTKSRKAGSK